MRTNCEEFFGTSAQVVFNLGYKDHPWEEVFHKWLDNKYLPHHILNKSKPELLREWLDSPVVEDE